MPTAKVKAVTAGRRVARVDARRSGRGTVEAVAKATGIPAHVVRASAWLSRSAIRVTVSDHLIDLLVVVFSIMTLSKVGRAIRFINIPFGSVAARRHRLAAGGMERCHSLRVAHWP